VDVINIDRGSNTASVLVEMLSKAWPEWTSTTATHIIIHGRSVYDSVVDEPQLKIPNRVNQQITKQTSNGWGRG